MLTVHGERVMMGVRRPKVLIVDDEETIRLTLHEMLHEDNDRYDVLLAGTAEIAQEILLDLRIDVIVTDIMLPGKSGMDLLSWAALECPDTRVVVMTAFDVSDIKDRAHAFGCLRLMRKPFDVHEMRATILRAIDQRDGFAGMLSELSSVDVIQMLCIGKKTTALRFSEGSKSGAVYIERGEVTHAVWDDLVGEEAFYRMLAVESGVFHTAPLPADIERTIESDWQQLLLEGLRRLDEAARDRGDSAPHTRRSPGSATADRPTNGHRMDVSHFIDEGFALLRAGRRNEARTAWEEAHRLDPQNRMVSLNLRKLNGAAAAKR